MSQYIINTEKSILQALNTVMSNKDFAQLRKAQKERGHTFISTLITELLTENEYVRQQLENANNQIESSQQRKLF